jgi:uncharacterized membrane protein
MTSITRGIVRGAAAGAAGTAALTAAGLLGDDRVTAPGGPRGPLAPLGTLAGPASGIAVGGLAGVLRAAGVRPPVLLGGPLLAAAALLAGAGPLPVPRSGANRVAGAAGALVFGLAAQATLAAVARVAEQREPVRAPRPAALLRAVALGAASGSRSTAGVAALAATSGPEDRGAVAGRLGGRTGTTLSALAAAGEFAGDKLPSTPTRTGLPPLLARAAAGAVAAGAVATRDGDDPAAPAVIGLVTAVATTFLAVRARAAAAERLGSDRPGAVAEDALAALLAWLGSRRTTA